MNKTVVVNFGKGNLIHGFPHIAVRLWTVPHLRPEQFVGHLPPAPTLEELSRIWQLTYRALSSRLMLRQSPNAAEDELEIEPGGVTNVSQQSLANYSHQLKQAINTWLTSKGILTVERQLRSHLNPTDEIRVIFETDDDSLLRLPWHCWDLFQDYPRAEIALSPPEYRRRAALHPRSNQQVRILAVLGDLQGIDIEAEQQALQALPHAEIEFLVTPSRQEFNHTLWDRAGWDVLFFAGHSQTEGEKERQTGRIYLNDNPTHNSLTIEQLEEALKVAIDNGLQLAIFNSCDGLGLAQALGRLQIPQVIVMREPVPNQVAHAFFQHFLDAFAVEHLPLYLAMRQARQRLQGMENEFPGASWLPVICQNPAVDPPTWLQLGGMAACPYRGLFAFQEADADLFFGREQVTKDLIAAVKGKNLVAVIGPSGSGKSSVVFAGLVPQLRSSQSSTGWRVISCRPGIKPFDALAEVLVEFGVEQQGAALRQTLVKPAENHSFRLKVLELAVELQANRQALCSQIERLYHMHEDKQLLLIVDQFEELYTLCPEADLQPFVEGLLDAVQFAPGFTLLLTLRADFYGYVLSDRRFSDALQGAVYNLGPMSRDELQMAIAQPAAQRQVTLEPGLMDKLIQSTWGHAGRLPLLEFALTQLWSKQYEGWLTHRAYTEIGGVEEAIANHAEGVYAQLSGGDRKRMQQILVQLAEPAVGTDPSRRLATRDEVGEANWDLVSHLASTRLVVTSRNDAIGEETVEIVHEALLRSWRRLEEWIEVDGDFRRWQEDLRIARRHWESSRQDEEDLLRGKLLTDAKYWCVQRDDELSSKDRAFVHLSLAAQERETRQRQQRRRLVISSLITGLVAALVLSGLTWWGWQRSLLSEVRAITATSDALFISGKPFDALIESLRADQKLKTLAWSETEAQTGVELALMQSLSRVVEQNRLEGHTGGVTAVAFSPDGQMIASASQDHTVKLWNPDGSLITTLTGHEDEVWGVAISPDSNLIASASNDNTAKLWNRDGSLITTFERHTDDVNTVAFSPNGQTIASGSSDNTIQLWHPDGSWLRTFTGHSDKINVVIFSLDGKTLASASDDKTIRLWKLDGTLVKILEGHTHAVRGIAFSPDGQWLASTGVDQTIKLWKADGTFILDFPSQENTVYDIKFSADSKQIISAGRDKTVKIWGLDGTLLRTLRGHEDAVIGVSLSPVDGSITSASLDRTVKIWNLKNPLQTTLNGHTDIVWDVAFNPVNQTIASGGKDKTINLWKRDGSLLSTLKGHDDAVYKISFSPDGQTIASGSKDKMIKLWKWDGSFLKTLSKHKGWVTGIAFSSDNQLIASASEDTTVNLWKRDGSFLKTLSGHTDKVWGVDFSPDSQTIASASNDRTIRLWKRDGSFIQALEGHTEGVNAVSFSPDNESIASASDDKTIRLWSRTGSLKKVLSGHTEKVIDVVFRPDGQLLASTSTDKTVKLWSKDGLLLTTLNGYSEGVLGAEFNPDGKALAVTSVDGSVVLWDVQKNLNKATLPIDGCNWLKNYLETNLELSKESRHLCQNIISH